MGVFGYDETHSETWTIDLELAQRLLPEQAEYHYYGAVAELATTLLGGQHVRVLTNWNEQLLSALDVVIIAHPAESSLERGCGGSPLFLPSEVDLVKRFVESGGALFVIGEYNISYWGANVNDLLQPFGLKLTDDTLTTTRGDRNPHLLARHLTCHTISHRPAGKHPAVKGVGRISYHRGCSVHCNGDSTLPLITAPGGEPVFAVAEYGDGRIAAIGDSDLFAIPFMGHHDNAQLYVSTLAWLSGTKTATAQVPSCSLAQTIRARSYPIQDFTEGELESHQVDCSSVDASQYGVTLLRLGADLPSLNDEREQFLLRAELAFHELPRSLRQTIVQFKHHANDCGALLITGLPADPCLPATPIDSRTSPEKRSYLSEFWLSVFGSALGDPMAYSQEKDAELFQDVAPTPSNEAELSSESSKILLDFHTETAFHPFMPDYLLLYCLRPDHERRAATLISSARMMVPRLPLKYRAVLFENMFRTGIDYSFGARSGGSTAGPVTPVLYGSPYDPFIKFDLDLMEGLTEDARQALVALKDAAKETQIGMYLNEGSLLIVDNRRAVHGRTQFTPRYDGFDRWLQRLYVVRDLALAEEDRRRNERIIETEFFF